MSADVQNERFSVGSRARKRPVKAECHVQNERRSSQKGLNSCVGHDDAKRDGDLPIAGSISGRNAALS